jgi:hypothetical protein
MSVYKDSAFAATSIERTEEKTDRLLQNLVTKQPCVIVFIYQKFRNGVAWHRLICSDAISFDQLKV